MEFNLMGCRGRPKVEPRNDPADSYRSQAGRRRDLRRVFFFVDKTD